MRTGDAISRVGLSSDLHVPPSRCLYIFFFFFSEAKKSLWIAHKFKHTGRSRFFIPFDKDLARSFFIPGFLTRAFCHDNSKTPTHFSSLLSR